MTNLGFMNTILSLKPRVWSGSQKTIAEQKNFVNADQKSKSCCSLLFDIHGIVYHEYLLVGQSVNAIFYMEVFQRLRDRMCRVRPNL